MALIVTPRQLSQRAQFYEQLAQLTAAGITVPAALDLLSRNPPSRNFRQPIREMIGHLSGGASVADSMQALGSWVPTFDIALIRAGENSGRMDVVFKMLAGYYNDRAALARGVISGMMYPVLVLHVAVLIFPFVSWFGGKIRSPGFFLETFGVLIPLYAAVYFIIFASQGKRGHYWRSIFEKVCRPIPVLGSARQALALSRLSAALEALINAGMTIIEAWEMAAAASGSPALQRTVRIWRPQLVAGQTPSEAVSETPGQFPEVFANLYHTGEVSGQLDDTLKRLHQYYQEEATRKLFFLAKWVPQFFYLCVAGMVAYKVISFYADYVNQINEAGKM